MRRRTCEGSSARDIIERWNSAGRGGIWNPNAPAPAVWLPDSDDYSCALLVLRKYGWIAGIEAGLGFALQHQRDADFTQRLSQLLAELEAYRCEGKAWLNHDKLYLYDRHHDTADVTRYGVRSLDHVTARAVGYWTTVGNTVRSTQALYQKTPYEPLVHVWEVLRVDLLPDPSAPYLGEPKQEQSPAPVVTPPEADMDTPSPRLPSQPSDQTAATLIGWKEIIPALEQHTGRTFGSERRARAFLRKHGIEPTSTGEKKAPVKLAKSALARLECVDPQGQVGTPRNT